MRTREPLHITVPIELSLWLRGQAKSRRLSISDMSVELFIKGIHAETVDETVMRIKGASESLPVRELLRQTLAVRYMIETQAKGKVSMGERLGTDALVWADKEMTRLLSGQSSP